MFVRIAMDLASLVFEVTSFVNTINNKYLASYWSSANCTHKKIFDTMLISENASMYENFAQTIGFKKLRYISLAISKIDIQCGNVS